MIFEPGRQVANFTGEISILELAKKNRIAMRHSCDGMGSCGTCRVVINKGLNLLPPRNEIEQEMSDDRGFQPQERLSCQTLAYDGLVVVVPQVSEDLD